MVSRQTKEDRARKAFHAELAKRPELLDRIAEGKAEHEKVKAAGGLRRPANRTGNGRARKR